MKDIKLHKRLLELLYSHKEEHVGSCFTCIDIIDDIFKENGIYCSTGSLGSGIIIAVGRALANPNRTVHVTLSDGECAEGCVWEALRFIEDYGLKNIKVHVNCNGWACYDIIDVNKLELRLKSFLPNIHIHRTNFNMLSFLKGLDSHYMILNNEQYEQGLKELS